MSQRNQGNASLCLWTHCGCTGDGYGDSCGRQVHKPVHERGDNADITALTRGNQSTMLWRKNNSRHKSRGDEIKDAVIEIRRQCIQGKPAQVIGLLADDFLRVSGH